MFKNLLPYTYFHNPFLLLLLELQVKNFIKVNKGESQIELELKCQPDSLVTSVLNTFYWLPVSQNKIQTYSTAYSIWLLHPPQPEVSHFSP